MPQAQLKCRCCSHYLEHVVVCLKSMPLTDDFVLVENPDYTEYLNDIEIYECRYCGLVQNPVDFDYEEYYKNYQYSTGHSDYAKKFMRKYAETVLNFYRSSNKREAHSLIEIGSGDGVQLQQFLDLGVSRVLGVEPSDYLAKIALSSGVPSLVDLYGVRTLPKINDRFDICLSSYTLDHVRNPVEYLETTHQILNEGGILAFEVHNLEKIAERCEYCLFEHEHTIYMAPNDAKRFVEQYGFRVLAMDPIESSVVRGNSLILIAEKIPITENHSNNKNYRNTNLTNLSNRIAKVIDRLNQWVDTIPADERLIGFGAGGRGVMTLAALKNPERFAALFDTNYPSGKFLTPKTRIPVLGPDAWTPYSNSYCLVFSFGYLSEIKKELIKKGFAREKIFSLSDFFEDFTDK